MLLFDGHLDLALNALEWNRDLCLPVAETRREETGMTQKGRGRGTVAFPELRAGGVGLCIATVLARVHQPGNPLPGYRTPEAAFAAAQGHLAWYRAMEERGVLRLIGDLPALDAHVADFEANPGAPLGVILTMEGADPLVYPEQVHRWRADGLRALGLSHYGVGRYAYGTSTPGPLTDLGRAVLPEARAAGLVLDLTHLADEAFWQVLERWDGPVQASHQACRALVPGDRQMDDAQLRAIIERGGVVGAPLDAWMLTPGWVRGETGNEACSLEMFVDHIVHVCDLAGNARHAAIGTDLDGGYGQEQTPHDLETIADLRRLPGLLAGRGFTPDDIAAVMHGNLLRLFRTAWSAA